MHWFSRGKKNIRFDRYNAAAGCYGCHRYLDSHPLEKTEFFLNLYGQGQFERLRWLADHPNKIDIESIEKDLKEKIKMLEAE